MLTRTSVSHALRQRWYTPSLAPVLTVGRGSSGFGAVTALLLASRYHGVAAAPTAPSTDATPQSGKEKDGAAAAAYDAAAAAAALNVKIDPKRLPSTIPGISQEELAARMVAYHAKNVQKANVMDEQHERAVAAEVDVMRRSMSPEDFEVYMQQLAETEAKNAAEQAKIAAMSPVQLHQYNAKLRRNQTVFEYYRTLSLLFVFFGSIFCIFFFFMFFE